MSDPDDDYGDDTVVAPPPQKEREDLAPPPKYAVVLLNDDFTPMDFVVMVLTRLFGRSQSEAEAIMLDVHKNGKGMAGTYPKDIAETKASQVSAIAQANEYPFLAEVEPLH
jgi:ATP-dependent Clp protease adaptor protein ClpS